MTKPLFDFQHPGFRGGPTPRGYRVNSPILDEYSSTGPFEEDPAYICTVCGGYCEPDQQWCDTCEEARLDLGGYNIECDHDWQIIDSKDEFGHMRSRVCNKCGQGWLIEYKKGDIEWLSNATEELQRYCNHKWYAVEFAGKRCEKCGLDACI